MRQFDKSVCRRGNCMKNKVGIRWVRRLLCVLLFWSNAAAVKIYEADSLEREKKQTKKKKHPSKVC